MTDMIKWRVTNSLPADGRNFGVYNDAGDPTKAKFEILPAGQVNIAGPARFGAGTPEAKADDALTVNGKTRLHGEVTVAGGAVTAEGDLTVTGRTRLTGDVTVTAETLSLQGPGNAKGLVMGARYPDWAQRWGSGMLHVNGAVAQLSLEYDKGGIDPDRRYFVMSRDGAMILGHDRKGHGETRHLAITENGIDAYTRVALSAKLEAQQGMEVRGNAEFKGPTQFRETIEVKNLRMETGGFVFIRNANPHIQHAHRYLQIGQKKETVAASPNTGDWEKWSFEISSSRALKENVARLDHREATAALMAMEPVKYDYIDAKAWRPNLGFIAEDMPDMLRSHDRKTVSFFEAIPVMTRVIQEHEKTIARLEDRIERLVARLEALAPADED